MNVKESIIYIIGDMVRKVLCEPEDKLFIRAVDTIVIENESTLSNKINAFIYGGILYKHSSIKEHIRNANTLQMAFVSQFENELYRHKEVHREIQQIWQSLLPLCDESPNHIREAFPEELIVCISALNYLKRSFPQQDYLDKLTDKQLTQYKKMLPKLRYYLSLRMVV